MGDGVAAELDSRAGKVLAKIHERLASDLLLSDLLLDSPERHTYFFMIA
jgi:hypothetical protein